MNEKDQKEIKKKISDAQQSFAGDIAEYLNYYNERLSNIEDKLGFKIAGYVEHLGHRLPIKEK